jgi:hypothetical protein
LENFLYDDGEVLCKKLHSDTNIYSGDIEVNLKLRNRLTTKHIALIAIFSALYAMLRYLPLGPMIGLEGSFSFSDALAPLIGLILGPFTGGISVIIGTFTAAALGKPIAFLGLDFLPGFINCVSMGLLMKRKWIPVVGLYALLLGIFVISPYSLTFVQVGSLAIPFVWLHIVALIVLLSPLRSKATDNIKKFNIPKMALSLTILAFIGTMLQHIMGSLLFQLVFGVLAEIPAAEFAGVWTAIFFVYPFERILMLIIAILIGTPLIIIIKRAIPHFETPLNEQEKKT